jgi:transposase
MNQTYLSKGMKMPSLKYRKTAYSKGDILIYAKTKQSYLKCSACKSKEVIKKGTTERKWKTAPNARGDMYIVVDVQRLECKECGAIKQEHLPFADKKKGIPDSSPYLLFPFSLGRL